MIEYMSKRASHFVSKTSRYVDSKVIRIGEQKYVTFSIYRRKAPQQLSQDHFLQITPPYEYRPDLVSFDLYGVSDYWWKIMEVNHMTDIMDFKAGRNIRVPYNILG